MFGKLLKARGVLRKTSLADEKEAGRNRLTRCELKTDVLFTPEFSRSLIAINKNPFLFILSTQFTAAPSIDIAEKSTKRKFRSHYLFEVSWRFREKGFHFRHSF
ncbi:hypothetical protein TNCT_504191 [Trichonephila clavata]|uniref:Uncharacterized protein n=1 Tax=Trichonephila clavata TaxID=2740835 RepID=A0A8X6KZD1_TRICU|nr:hypothetical protein TNCT_504191 [Trichonephila clavata]